MPGHKWFELLRFGLRYLLFVFSFAVNEGIISWPPAMEIESILFRDRFTNVLDSFGACDLLLWKVKLLSRKVGDLFVAGPI